MTLLSGKNPCASVVFQAIMMFILTNIDFVIWISLIFLLKIATVKIIIPGCRCTDTCILLPIACEQADVYNCMGNECV